MEKLRFVLGIFMGVQCVIALVIFFLGSIGFILWVLWSILAEIGIIAFCITIVFMIDVLAIFIELFELI